MLQQPLLNVHLILEQFIIASDCMLDSESGWPGDRVTMFKFALLFSVLDKVWISFRKRLSVVLRTCMEIFLILVFFIRSIWKACLGKCLSTHARAHPYVPVHITPLPSWPSDIMPTWHPASGSQTLCPCIHANCGSETRMETPQDQQIFHQSESKTSWVEEGFFGGEGGG